MSIFEICRRIFLRIWPIVGRNPKTAILMATLMVWFVSQSYLQFQYDEVCQKQYSIECERIDRSTFIEQAFSFVDRFPNNINAISAAIVAALTIVLAFATWRQAEFTRRALGHSENAAKAAAVGAEMAQQSVGIAADTAKRQLRAYISVSEGAVIFQNHQNPVFEFRPILKNEGLTPAKHLAVVVKCAVLASQPPEDYDFGVDFLEARGTSTIGPQQSKFMNANLGRRLSKAEYLEVTKFDDINCRRIFVWGSVAYYDVFEQIHITNFCFLIVWTNDKRPIWMDYRNYNNAT